MCRTLRSHVLLLQWLFWFSWPALSLNIPQLSSPFHKELMNPNENIFCLSRPTLEVYHPVQEDCEVAIDKLPSAPGRAVFHIDPPNDSFRLPTKTASRSCVVSVSMNFGFALEVATWPEIRAKAGEVNQRCIPPTRALSYTIGGAAWAGEEGGIVVQLLNPGRR